MIGSVSRGHGRLQRAILAELAQAPGSMLTADLVGQIYRQDTSARWNYYTLATSMRRALGQLCRERLVDCADQLAAQPGRPKAWQITGKGRRRAGSPAGTHQNLGHAAVTGRHAPDPAYLQVADDLAGPIRSGTLAGRLPAERELAARYRVSCGSIRHAMAVLRDLNLIHTIPGRGTFATPDCGLSRHQ